MDEEATEDVVGRAPELFVVALYHVAELVQERRRVCKGLVSRILRFTLCVLTQRNLLLFFTRLWRRAELDLLDLSDHLAAVLGIKPVVLPVTVADTRR